LLCILLVAGLSACVSSPPIRYFSLDDGRSVAGASKGPSVLVVRADVPELIDRPQLVARTANHEVRVSDLDQWAEPLRQQIPRVLARDLGEMLDSGRVAALTTDAVAPDADFKVMLDIQRMEVVAGKTVEVDALWRVQTRSGGVFYGRSRVVEPISDAANADDYPAMVAAQSRALRTVASDIAAGVSRSLKGG
jgi:uncharacterized lipoprotein YmbA